MGTLVVVTDDRFGDYSIERSILEPAGAELRVANCASETDVAEACRDAVVVLANLAPVGAAAIAAMAKCRAVCRYGVGLDNVDVAAATARGIAVRNVPGYCDDEVAEHALALLLDRARSLSDRDRSVRSGDWGTPLPATRVRGTILGVLGFGGTAKALVRKACGFGFKEILVWSPRICAPAPRTDPVAAELPDVVTAAAALGTAIRAATAEELLGSSDFVSLHLALNDGTRGFLSAGRIASVKKGAMLVNTARGALVDETALAAALHAGKLGGAGLDVFAEEPLPADSPLRTCPRTVLTDHAAYLSTASIAELKRRTALNALEFLR